MGLFGSRRPGWFTQQDHRNADAIERACAARRAPMRISDGVRKPDGATVYLGVLQRASVVNEEVQQQIALDLGRAVHGYQHERAVSFTVDDSLNTPV